MYDDRTYDKIMEEMLDEFGQEVNTDESSLAYNACAKTAEKLEDVYADMSMLNDNMTPDTMDLEHLIKYGTQNGVEYQYAQAPIVKGVFKQSIEIGKQFTCGDFTYTASELIEGFAYKLACDTEGTAANSNLGELDPVDYIDDYEGGTITEIIVEGKEDEDIEKYRERATSRKNSMSFGGNKADYQKKIDGIEGVGGCKPFRREKGSQWINIYVISNTYRAPTQKDIEKIQTIVDPEQSRGEGDGIAPICHEVKIKPVEEVNISVSIQVTLDEGISKEDEIAKAEKTVEEYLLSIRKEWEKSASGSQYVRISQIEAKILSISGITDVANAKINGNAENLMLKPYEVPIFGGVTIV